LISFKGAQYPKSVILYAVYFYVRFPVSYRDLEEIMAERSSWRMDETYVKVKGKWTYLYRAIDKAPVSDASIACRAMGKTLDFMLSETRDEAAATAFFAKAISNNGWRYKVVIDKSGSNTAGLFNMNCLLALVGWVVLVDCRSADKISEPLRGSANLFA